MGKSNYPVIYGGDLRKNQCDGVLTPLKSNLNLLMLLQSLEGDASLRQIYPEHCRRTQS